MNAIFPYRKVCTSEENTFYKLQPSLDNCKYNNKVMQNSTSERSHRCIKPDASRNPSASARPLKAGSGKEAWCCARSTTQCCTHRPCRHRPPRGGRTTRPIRLRGDCLLKWSWHNMLWVCHNILYTALRKLILYCTPKWSAYCTVLYR